MKEKPLSKITISDLCKEAGVNRATFYNHYETPAAILKEIAAEYASELTEVYESNRDSKTGKDDAALEACLIYIQERKAEIKILFSENAEHALREIV